MLFFSKAAKNKKVNNSVPERPTRVRRALRLAFSPEVGSAVRPMQEATDMFVNVLAMIFISQKMFPAHHPAYLGQNGRHLSLALLLRTVWQNLTFTKQSVPQVLLFFTVVFGIGFAGLAFILLLMSLMIGKAHAATSYFTTTSTDDIAQSWIDFLFSVGAGGWTGLFTHDPLLGSAAVQTALISALAFYSDAILIVAAVILFYHLSSMVVETAHHGVVMGKRANQIWAPIRLVVAVGLLVPIGGGLNSGQFIVIQTAKWGSALASNVWNIFLTGLSTDLAGQGVAFVPFYARDAVYNTMLTETCRVAYNSYDNKGTNSLNQNDASASNAIKPTSDTATTGGISTSRVDQTKPDVTNSQRCGHYGFNAAETPGAATATATQAIVQTNAQVCFTEMQTSVQQYAQTEASYFTDDDVGGASSTATPQYDGQMDQFVGDYISCLSDNLPVPDLLAVFAQSADWGWVSAGATLSAIAQAEADANDLGNLIPETQAPDFSGTSGDPVMKKVAAIVTAVDQHINMLPSGGAAATTGAIGSDSCSAQRAQLIAQANGMAQQGNAKDHLLERIFQFVDWVAAWNCVWNSAPNTLTSGNFTLGIQFDGPNPLAEMAHLGHANIDTAEDVFDIYVNLMANGGEAVAKAGANADLVSSLGGSFLGGFLKLGPNGAQGALSFVGGLLSMICTVFLVSGIMLAYYLPLIPFIRFLFNVLTWAISVLESVLGIPLVALAHLNPEGDGLPGNLAKASYYFVFNIFLRPTMMVFGLIIGLLVFYIAVSYMNLFYGMAFSTSGGLANGHIFLSRLLFSALYVIILYMCANSCFKCISWMPEHAVRWMGGQVMHFQSMGEPDQVGQVLMQGTGNLSQIVNSVQSGGFGAAKAAQGMGGAGAGGLQRAIGATAHSGGAAGGGTTGGGGAGGAGGAQRTPLQAPATTPTTPTTPSTPRGGGGAGGAQ